jgi:hypothetical protein
VTWVTIHRVCGEIAVSRSIGDPDYKTFVPGEKVDAFFVWPDGHDQVFMGDLVIPTPEVKGAVGVARFVARFVCLGVAACHRPSRLSLQHLHTHAQHTLILHPPSSPLIHPTHHSSTSHPKQVKTVTLSPTDEFLIIASDGLWDVVSNVEAVSRARAAFAAGKTSTDAAEELCDLALKLGSSDNVTIVIVQFFHGN